jgi:penicillin amidase
MPCGQSGHPLSPHYSDSHDAWCEGVAVPFMPGETVHTLVLKPAEENKEGI